MSDRRFVLIVDDDPHVASSIERLVRFLLPRADGEYAIATEPLRAIEIVDELAASDRPLLILCDFNLRAKLDGLQLLDEARRSHRRAHLVLVSAYPREELGLRPEFGVLDAFLPKPFSAAQLRDVIAPFAEGSGAASQATE